MRAELQRQLGEAQALAESRAAAMRDMQDKIQHLSARVGAVLSFLPFFLSSAVQPAIQGLQNEKAHPSRIRRLRSY